ncbi:MAG TPA: EF2563 family selenium-dependent molybdenum hydroxylase system protein [Chloroflexi bacterium]|nr:EF2563 family selenium-dependent molybdenum hydroxylase system protein [Chloroflexota bacterium]
MLVLIRGGGDLGSGVGLRLHRAGMEVAFTEIARPLVVRRTVAFAEAVYSGECRVEEVTARKAETIFDARDMLQRGEVPVFVDRELRLLQELQPNVLVDARLVKRPPETLLSVAPLVIGLGPGFTAGQNCHAVVETMRGHCLGRVYWQGTALEDTGIPEAVGQHREDRVLRAPATGEVHTTASIGDVLDAGELIAVVNGRAVKAPFRGLLRGLVADGLEVHEGMKIGDIDPRLDPKLVRLVSDKALAIGGGVLEAILAFQSGRYRSLLDGKSG